jgi:hypothetical protein
MGGKFAVTDQYIFIISLLHVYAMGKLMHIQHDFEICVNFLLAQIISFTVL